MKKLIEENGGFLKMSFGTYHVHLFYLPYDENLIHYYNNNHKFVWDRMDHKELSKTMIFEKMEIKWFSIDELKQKKGEFRYFYQTFVDDLLENQKSIKDFITLKKTKKNKTLKNK